MHIIMHHEVQSVPVPEKAPHSHRQLDQQICRSAVLKEDPAAVVVGVGTVVVVVVVFVAAAADVLLLYLLGRTIGSGAAEAPEAR
jgi:hypothetical protein